MSTEAPPAPKRGKNIKLAFRLDPSSRAPGFLPPEIAVQGPLATTAFTMLRAKPGRSLASIARELGTSSATLTRLNRAGRWAYHLQNLMRQSAESLAFAAQQEAQRSRAELLASNRLAQGAVDAALADLVEVDEHGNVRLKPGRTVQDVQRLQQARQTHVKTTGMLTGTDAAERRLTAAAGATKIVMRVGAAAGEPVEQPTKVAVVVSDPVSTGRAGLNVSELRYKNI